MSNLPRQLVIARGWIMVAAAMLALAACGGDGPTEQQASKPSIATTEKSTSSSDPLEGEWRTEFACRESVDAIQRRLSPKQIRQQVGRWEDFLGGWGAKPTRKDPCHQASGTTALLARFADGNLALCDAETLQCEVNATYELLGKHSIRLDDREGNLCDSNCPVRWRFELTGDKLTFQVSPDAFVISAWEASFWTRKS
jgi:predicted small lipoprotein YifL